MSRGALFALICGVSLLNGLAPLFGLKSLTFALTWVLRAYWLPNWLDNVAIAIYLACLIASTFVLLLAGIPAALYERLWQGERGGNGGLYAWLLGAIALTLAAVRP